MRVEYFNRRTDLVYVTTHNVVHNLVVGMALVILILFVFLGDITCAGIVAIMIPLALLFSIVVLFVQDKSANLLSIGAVDFGIIVDSSTIIVENIYRHITAPGADRSRPLIDQGYAPMMRSLGEWVLRHRKMVMLSWLLIAIAGMSQFPRACKAYPGRSASRLPVKMNSSHPAQAPLPLTGERNMRRERFAFSRKGSKPVLGPRSPRGRYGKAPQP